MERGSVIFLPPSMMSTHTMAAGTQVAAVEEASNIISASADRPALANAVHALRDLLGLEHIAYHALRLDRASLQTPYLLLSYDKQWVDRYMERDYFGADPVVCQGGRQLVPFDWSTLNRQAPRAKSLFAEAERYGVGRQGITIPIRGPNGERALFTITSNARAEDWTRFRAVTIRTFTEIGQYLHDRVATLEGARKISVLKLSRREHQCLQMMAHGSLPKDIAFTLNLSPSAVRLYLTSAKCKMGSATLYQAIARAAALQIISP